MNYQELKDLYTEKSAERLTHEWEKNKEIVIRVYTEACEDYNEHAYAEQEIKFHYPHSFASRQDIPIDVIRNILHDEYEIPTNKINVTYTDGRPIRGGGQRMVSIDIT